MLSDLVRDVRAFLRPGSARALAIPPLDGPLLPDDGLERLPAAGDPVPSPDDLLAHPDGALLVSTGRRVLRLEAGGAWEQVAELPGAVTALAAAPDGAIYAGVDGGGLAEVDLAGHVRRTVPIGPGGLPGAPNALAVGPEGRVYATIGSSRHAPAEWPRDLMERNRLGSVVAVDPRGTVDTVAEGLAYPFGVVLTGDGGLLVSEAWRHRVLRVPVGGGAAVPVIHELPGYPGRIVVARDGGYWLAVFALRTHLVEFVLEQRAFCDEMMRTIAPEYWIRPALRTLEEAFEPLQEGQIKKLGKTKPWAPPRSYGLLVRLGADGLPVASLHSRAGGRRHGVTGVAERDGAVYVAAQGGDAVLRADIGKVESA